MILDKVPFGARCDFEHGWCGWENDLTKPIQWSRRSQGIGGLKYDLLDHTFYNASGHYLVVDMAEHVSNAPFAAMASVSSTVFNPPPMAHSNESSPYYNTCSVSQL